MLRDRLGVFFLFIGDVFFFALALWVTLLLRTLTLPDSGLFLAHIVPFSLLFVAWVGLFFIVGLYDPHTTTFVRELPKRIFFAQAVNVIVAALFFFLIPYFGITPKTILFIYLAVSSLLISFWRLALFPRVRVGKKEKAVIVCEGAEMEKLLNEINAHPRFSMSVVRLMPPGNDPRALVENITALMEREGVDTLILHFDHETVQSALPQLYKLTLRGVRFIDAAAAYEDIFHRVPLSLLGFRWVLNNLRTRKHFFYDVVKRGLDFVIALLGVMVFLPFCFFVWIAIFADDRGPLFVVQERIGQYGKRIKIAKFRSMTGNDSGAYGENGKTELSVTRVGKWLRLTRIDEIPQFFSVLRGDQSLVGPRPELPALVEIYERDVPFYGFRHLVKPGLSGWAQIYAEHAHHGADREITARKLSYDLYYIKHRSLILDLHIGLKTFRALMTKSGV